MLGRRKPANYPAGTKTFLNRRGVIVVCLCVFSLFLLTTYGAYAGLFALEQCNYCSGKKSIEVQCDECEGKGKVAAEVTCSKCYGQREVTKMIDCQACDHDGKIEGWFWDDKCSVCSGSGKIEELVDCKSCNGKGLVPGEIECSTCNGHGKVTEPCSMCGATGEIMRMLNKRNES